MDPTPLQHLLHEKAWTLSDLCIELKKRNTPCSYITLLLLKKGYRTKKTRDKFGEIIKEEKITYNPNRRTLADIAKVFKVKPEEVYADRSK